MQTVLEGGTGPGSPEGRAARVKWMCAERGLCTGRGQTDQDPRLLWTRAKPGRSFLRPGKQKRCSLTNHCGTPVCAELSVWALYLLLHLTCQEWKEWRWSENLIALSETIASFLWYSLELEKKKIVIADVTSSYWSGSILNNFCAVTWKLSWSSLDESFVHVCSIYINYTGYWVTEPCLSSMVDTVHCVAANDHLWARHHWAHQNIL